jgi:hypothetical protein
MISNAIKKPSKTFFEFVLKGIDFFKNRDLVAQSNTRKKKKVSYYSKAICKKVRFEKQKETFID